MLFKIKQGPAVKPQPQEPRAPIVSERGSEHLPRLVDTSDPLPPE